MKRFLVTLGAGALPFVAFAQNSPDVSYIQDLITSIGNILNAILPVLVAFGVIYFIWNVIWYVVAANEEAKAQAKQRVGYGLIGLVVIFALWGLVAILVNLFGVSTTETPLAPPGLPTQN